MKFIQNIKRLSILTALVFLFKCNVFHTAIDPTTTIGEALQNIHIEQLVKILRPITNHFLVHNVLLNVPEKLAVPNIQTIDSIIQSSGPYQQWRVYTDNVNYAKDVLNSVINRYNLQLDDEITTHMLRSTPDLLRINLNNIPHVIQTVKYRVISRTGILYIIKLCWVYSGANGALTVQPQVYQVGLNNYTKLLNLGISIDSINKFILSKEILDSNSPITQRFSRGYAQILEQYFKTNPHDRVLWGYVLDELVIKYQHCLKEGGTYTAVFKQYIKTIQQNKTLLIDMLSNQHKLPSESEYTEMSKVDFNKILLQQHRKSLDNLKKLIEPQNNAQINPTLEQLADLLERLNSTQIIALYNIYHVKKSTPLPIVLAGTKQNNGVTLNIQIQQKTIQFWNQLRPNTQLDVFNHWASLYNYLDQVNKQTNDIVEKINWTTVKSGNTYLEPIYNYYFGLGKKEALHKFLQTILILLITGTILYGLYYIYQKNQVINKALLDHVTKVVQSLTGISYVINALGAQNILAILLVAILLLSVIILMLLKVFRTRTVIEKTY